MKSAVKLVLIVTLFSSVVFADGEMGNGGKTCTSNCLTTTQTTGKEAKQPEINDSILTFVQSYWDSIFEYLTDKN
jgi:hypothetical protein